MTSPTTRSPNGSERVLLVFEDTIDIPANQVPVGPDGYPVKLRVEGDFEHFRQQIQDEARAASQVLAGARYTRQLYARQGSERNCNDAGTLITAQERLDIERTQRRDFTRRLCDALGLDNDPAINLVEAARTAARERDTARRLATEAAESFDTRRQHLTDALGMDRLRDWDDITNAARGLRKDRDAKRDCMQAAARLHQRVEHRGQTICGHCSAWDGTEYGSTDNPPILYPCDTVKALTGYTGEDATATQSEKQPS